MPFADPTHGIPIHKVDAAIHIVRDGDIFKAIVVTDLDRDEVAPIVREVAKWCVSPDDPVMCVSTNVAINWVEI